MKTGASDLLGLCLRHTTRGVLIGALAGGAVGGAEAYLLLSTSRVARTALREAAVYAVVVDALAVAAASGLLALLLALIGGLLAGRRAEPRLAALQIAAAPAFTIFAAGYLWLDRLEQTSRSWSRQVAPPAAAVLVPLAGAALLTALLLYALIGGRLTRATLRWPRATAAATLAITGTLMGVVPAQVLAETQGYRPPAATRTASAGSIAVPGGAPTAATPAGPPRPANQAPGERGAEQAAGARPQERRPNVVLITVDALRADHLGACGEADGLTPYLDRLAARGTLFCHAHVHQPQTNPSLASLFSGQLPATHGVRAHMSDRLPESVPTLATLLRDAGYATGGLAPWTSLKPAFSGLHRGFETYEAAALGEPTFLEHPFLQGAAGVFQRISGQLWLGRIIGSLHRAEDALEEQLDGRADVSTDRAVAWLAANGREPFLLWVHYYDPHYPWTPPPPYDTKHDPDYVRSPDDVYDGSWRTFYAYAAGEWAPQPRDVQHLRALYAGEVGFADAQIGRLLAALTQAGLDATTLVVVTADHGESFGEHDQWLHGDSLYEHELRVPLIVAGPGVPPGQRVDRLARQVDVLPTILDLLRLAAPAPIDGRSLVPLVRGEDDGRDRVSFSQVGDDSVLAVVTGDLWKLILDYRRDAIELYYLPEDPHETDNRAPREWWRVRELFGQLDRWADAKQMDWLDLPEFRFGL